MNNVALSVSVALVAVACHPAVRAQGTHVPITGKVVDARSKVPLVDGFVAVKGGVSTVTDSQGNFTVSVADPVRDSIRISYIGYSTWLGVAGFFAQGNVVIALREQALVLPELVVLDQSKNNDILKSVERSMRLVRGGLYAAEAEVTNADFNAFLAHLLETGQDALFERYKPRPEQTDPTMRSFFRAYHAVTPPDKKGGQNYAAYPVVNITHEAANAYCAWLTEVYNASERKRRYGKVRFRLPSIQEWQIAALGYRNFQSWELDDNVVEVTVPENAVDEVGRTRKKVRVGDSDILYPWFGSYNYRNRPQNRRSCWMANFLVPDSSVSCAVSRPGGDGFEVTAPVASFFPNGMGLFDVVGNAAEMIGDEGSACGGSWNHLPNASTLRSITTYDRRDPAVGFRVFMEVVAGKDPD